MSYHSRFFTAAESSLLQPIYLRFLSRPVADIRSRLLFRSDDFVFAMFQTMVR